MWYYINVYRSIIKNKQEFINIINDIKQGKQAHTYLFVSKDSILLKYFVRMVAQALLCPELCDRCENCIKVKEEHPDVKIFPKKNQLLVEDSNYIVEESFIKPIFADKKIFIIDDFDKSTEEAQNKLLKVFEEPNSNMYYLLSSTNPDNILPTIKSRCLKIDVLKCSNLEINTFLENDDLKNSIAIALGNGLLGKSILLSQNENLLDIFNLAKDILCKLKTSKEIVEYSKLIIDQKENINLFFEIFNELIEELIYIKTKQEDLQKYKFIEKDLVKIVDDFSLNALILIGEMLVKIMKEISYNTNIILIVDNFLMKILEVKYLCK